jgi:hypothetical protein
MRGGCASLGPPSAVLAAPNSRKLTQFSEAHSVWLTIARVLAPMGKKLRGIVCICCAAGPSTTGDYVFAREPFAKARSDNAPRVPACAECNGKRSELEL